MFPLLVGLMMLAIGVNGYTYYPSVQQTYHFYNIPKIWVDARDQCIQEGGNLALPRNNAEANVLKSIFAQNPVSTIANGANPNYFLVNFHDLYREGEYVTDKGVALQYYFLKWGKTQPDNMGGNENCGSFHRDGVLNDFPCDMPTVFVCQKTKPEIFIPDPNCLTKDSEYKYSPQTKRCYKLHLNPRAWPEARAICKAEGGNLAIINSQIEANVLKNKLNNLPFDKVSNPNFKDFALIGFHDLFKDGKFVTVEGKDLQTTGFTQWGPGEPNNFGGKEDCGSLYKLGTLNDFSCSSPTIFFCEMGSKFSPTPSGKGNNGNVSNEDNGQNHIEVNDNVQNAPNAQDAQNIDKRSSRYPR